MIFRRVDTDRQEWRSEDGRYLVERVWVKGPRGGNYQLWHLYRIEDRMKHIAQARRLQDIWAHVDAMERPDYCESCGGPCRDESPVAKT